MTRRLTSLFVGALALLVSATVSAETQQMQKSAPSKQFALKSSAQVLKSAEQARILMLKASEAHLGTKTDINYVGRAVQTIQKNSVDLDKLMQNNLDAVKSGKRMAEMPKGISRFIGGKMVEFNFGSSTRNKAPRRAGEVVDEYGVITAPAEGTTKIYTRSGMSLYPNSSYDIVQGEQDGNIEVVETEDGTVYFKDFISRVNVSCYVKGTRKGNTITIPSGQIIYYMASDGYGLYLTLAVKNGDSYEAVEGDIVLTVDGDVITMQNTGNPEEGGTIVGSFWTDDNLFSGYGDYSTVFTYDPDYVAPELVELPEDATVLTWNSKASKVSSSSSTTVQGTAKVAFVGEDIYLSGLFQSFPNAWIKGTLSGTTVTFSGLQYVGDYGSLYIYAVGTNGSTLEDFTMTYDADNQRLTSNNSLLANAKEDEIYYLEWLQDITIQAGEFEEEAVATGADVDVLPYSNTLTTAEEFADFGVIDANEDGKTWTFNSNSARYAYSSSNNGDDWLVSPRILLKAGKVYHFAIDAKAASASFAERLEVKMATEAKVSKLADGIEIIPSTDIATTTFTTYENVEVMVSETGYYCFGIHAISDANMFNLYVTNFLVEEGAEASAPGAVTDLTVTQVEDQLQAVIAFNAPTTAINGDALTGNIAKIEILRDGNVIKTFEDVAPGAALSYTDNDETLAIGSYTYQVITYSADGIGGKSDEVSVMLTAVLEVPYVADLTDQSVFATFAVIDNNADNKTWSWSSSNNAFYSYSSSNKGDDYLVSMPIHMEAGKNYEVTVAAYAASDQYAERFEVVYGKEATAEGLTNVAIAATEVAVTAATDFTGSFTVAEEGNYFVAIHAISDADMYRLMVKSLSIMPGADASSPSAVTDLTVTPGDGVLEATIAFNAPTTAINGDALTSNIAKIEILRDGAVIKTYEDVAPGTALSYTDNDETLEIGTYTYQVITYSADGIGGKSDEVSVFLTAVLEVPYVADLTDKSVFALFAVIDNNADNKTWGWTASTNAYYSYSGSNDADDYLVSMPIHMEAGKNYKVTVAAYAGNAQYPERFEVVYGKEATAEGLTNVAIAATEVANSAAEDFTNEFTVAEEGNYYVAIHAISDADMYRLQVKSLSVVKGAETTAPAAVADLAAVAGAEGALEVNINFTAPAKAINGNALSGNLEKVEILRDEQVVYTFEDVTPGSQLSWKDTEVENAKTYAYQVVAYNASGAGAKCEKVSVYVGIDVPAQLAEVGMVDLPNSILLAWDKVGNVGVNGGYVNPAQVSYKVWTATYSSYYGLVEDEQVATVTDEDSFNYTFNTDEGDQQFKYMAVQPSNEVGDGSLTYSSVLVGKPYDLPLVEGFEGKTMHYLWDYNNARLYISTDASDGDGTALRLAAVDPGLALFMSGKLALAGTQNPTLVFDVKSQYIDQLIVVGKTSEGTVASLANAPVSEEYTTVKVPLTSIQDERYSIVGFVASFTETTDDVIIDNIRIVDLYENNLSVAIEAPATVNAGNVADVKVTVANEGENAATGFTVKLTAGDLLLMEQTVSEELAPFTAMELSAKLETSIFDDDAELNLQAEVIYDAEQKPEDNLAEQTINVKASTAVAPTNLTAVNGDEGVVLTWTAEESVPVQMTEGFEDQSIFEVGSVGGINSYTHTGAFGDWTLYDGNGVSVYGWSNYSVPGIGDPSAWVVLNPAEVDETFASSYAPKSGEQVLISMCAADGSPIPATDHWLISPVLSGEAQTLSFFAREITTNYGAETFEILASSTDTAVESFDVVASLSCASTTWTEFTADLPEGTKYFAIRHTAQDIFGLLIDDITFTTMSSAPVAFNIYVDREKFADTTEKTATLANLPAGDHEFGVSAVYANGAESKPAVTTLTVVTSINQIASDNKPVDIYSLDGRLVSRQATSLKGLKGAYVVNERVVVIK